jgi:RNA polymerase sigma-70 factor (ECF subfamily)
MSSPSTKTAQLQRCLDRLQAGDGAAGQDLLNSACERVEQLTRKMLRRFPRVRRWEQTDDVVQNVVLRLHRTLSQVAPASVRDFLRLTSLNIRRELLDLVKHYYGPEGLGARHESAAGNSDTNGGTPDLTHEPTRLAAWTEFHRQVETLPEEQREVFDLLWYQGLPQAEAAALLGVTERTVQRRWQAARLALYDALHGDLPPSD